jgi:hypothetical protein
VAGAVAIFREKVALYAIAAKKSRNCQGRGAFHPALKGRMPSSIITYAASIAERSNKRRFPAGPAMIKEIPRWNII